jgi:Trk-type K+ transport system membrane component
MDGDTEVPTAGRGDGVVGRIMRRVRLRLRHPAQFLTIGLAIATVIGTVLLAIPVARAGPGGAPLLTALFTAVSALSVTGLIVVDTPVYWTTFGHVVLLVLMQLGGFGIMTAASLFAVFLSRRLGLRQRLLAQAETRAVRLGDVRRVVLGVAIVSLVSEAVTAAIIAVRLAITYDEPVGRSLWYGVFHAVSAFNQGGFALYSDSLTRFVTDPFVNIAVALAITVGGLGFPVFLELARLPWRPAHWSLHTRLTLFMTGILVAAGWFAVLWFEWTNPRTLGPLSTGGKLLASMFHGVTPRTGGLNTLDVGAMREPTWFVTDVLMFIGGGSASTAGGIKVTTVAVLTLMIWAEARGDSVVEASGRTIPTATQRQALAIAAVAMGVVTASALAIVAMGPFSLSEALFEASSAFGTVGLSTGITDDLPAAGHGILVALMFLGRVGPLTLGAALALRHREKLYRHPEERPIVG